MRTCHQERALFVRRLMVGLSLFLAVPLSVSLAQVAMPITSSGLNTTISAPITLPSGETQFDITGGTRPGGGPNLFHSFGNFDVPDNNIANFLNTSGLATSNILGRVTGGNISDIFGTIQTTGFGNANLFLMNPAGVLFGPTATVNVGGMMTFTSADNMRLADNTHFNAVPNAGADQLLSTAPIVAFGFLGSNPGAITVQGSHLAVAEGTGISLIGGTITIQDGTLTAPSGQITLVSVDRPSHSKMGGEVVSSSGQGPEFNPTGFKSLGAITLSQGSTIDTSATAGSGPLEGHTGGQILIRGGQFIMDASEMNALTQNAPPGVAVGNIEVTAKHVALTNQSSLDTSTSAISFDSPAGDITFNVDTFSATDSAIRAFVLAGASGGAVTIQGLQGSGDSAHSVSLTNTTINTSSSALPFLPPSDGGPIGIRADNIELTHSLLSTNSSETIGGPITLVATHRIKSHDSSFFSISFSGSGGLVDFDAGKSIDLTNTTVLVTALTGIDGGSIALSAPRISLSGSELDATSSNVGHGGTISLTGRQAVSLTNGTVLSADNDFIPSTPFLPSTANPNGGSIHIDGGAKFTSQQSTISAQSGFGNGGTIRVEAHKVGLTDTQLTTSVSGGPQTIAGKVTVDAHAVDVQNSQILSTATEGQGGLIAITSHNRHPVTNSVIDATSQFGTDGTVTIKKGP